VTFHINDDSVVVTHVDPAHTDGDALVYFAKANVLHTGDLFVSAGLPFVDLSSGGSIHGVIKAAETIIAMTNRDTKIIPGHGPIADRARVEAFRNMLVQLRNKVRADVASRKTVEQVIAANHVAPFARDWPNGHERFIRLLHAELARQR
jgi:glyoxylase-like metal-dependent hydrolase (beta-lactamase superfamily II)